LKTLAIIGGTGLGQLEGLEIVRSHPVETPFGYHVMKRLDPDKVP